MCEYGAVGKYELFRVIRFLNIFNMGKGKKNAGTSQAERAFRSGTCAFAKVCNLLISVPNLIYMLLGERLPCMAC